MPKAIRRSWASIKQERAKSSVRRTAYREAREAFDIAAQVRRAREDAGITQQELAERIGSTQPAMARLEAGGVRPSLATLERIAAALDLDLIVELRRRPAA